MKSRLLALALLLPVMALPQRRPAKQAEVKIQRTSYTRDQEVQLGKEAAAQVEREMEVVKNPEVEDWLNQIGGRLAKTPQANAYPYYFKLVNEDSINAFALPGGPMYVHTGLIKAADSEAEVAGVLAHEMSHVALRHGAAQMSKQQLYGSIFGALGALGGIFGNGTDCTLWCQAVQMGAGLGSNSLLLKFSRGYEHDADLNGARMMAATGYNPIELANFFEKLQASLGTAGEPKGLQSWFTSHPATGNRIQYVSEDIQFYPKRTYSASTGNFARVQQTVARIPPPKLKPAALLTMVQNPAPRGGVPEGFKDYQAKGFSIAYPNAWQAGQPQSGGRLYLVPSGGAKQGQNNSVELLTGAMIDYYVPASGSTANLAETTVEFVQSLEKGDASLKAGKSISTMLGRNDALLTRLTTKTSAQQDQVVFLYTVAREAGLWYLVLAAAQSQQDEFDPAFRRMTQTVAFPNL
ncbi:MAG: M48 family metallopeptidase [Acidobacteriota bacterium]